MVEINPDKPKNEIAVAAVDILGVKKIAQTPEGAEKIVKILKILYKRVSESLAILPLHTKGGYKKLWDVSSEFGDSMYLFGNPHESSTEQSNNLILLVSDLIRYGLFDSDVPFILRCGVSLGNLCHEGAMYQDPLTKEYFVKNIRMGKPIVDAHILESNQEWCGGTISEEVLEKCGIQLLAGHKIPFGKNEKENQEFKDYCKKFNVKPINFAINWLAWEDLDNMSTEVILKRIKEVFESNSDKFECDYRGKLENTKNFVKEIRKTRDEREKFKKFLEDAKHKK